MSSLGLQLNQNSFVQFADVDTFYPAPENYENACCIFGVGKENQRISLNSQSMPQISSFIIISAVCDEALEKTDFELQALMESIKKSLENPHTLL